MRARRWGWGRWRSRRRRITAGWQRRMSGRKTIRLPALRSLVGRDLAAASTNNAVVEIVQENSGDDQSALKVRQDGTGDIVQVFDDVNEVFVVQDGGFVAIGGATAAQSVHMARTDINPGVIME